MMHRCFSVSGAVVKKMAATWGGGMLVLCAVMCGCTSAKRNQPSGTSTTNRLDEDGNVMDYLVQNVSFKEASEEWLLGSLLEQSRTALPDRDLRINLYRRDRRPVVEPQPEVLQTQDLLSVYNDSNSGRDDGMHTGAFKRVMLSKTLAYIADYVGAYVLNTYGDSAILEVDIGAPELVGLRWKRKAYRVPRELREQMQTLPEQLDVHGESVAYHKGKEVLVAVGPSRSDLWALIEAFGCVEIKRVEDSGRSGTKGRPFTINKPNDE